MSKEAETKIRADTCKYRGSVTYHHVRFQNHSKPWLMTSHECSMAALIWCTDVKIFRQRDCNRRLVRLYYRCNDPYTKNEIKTLGDWNQAYSQQRKWAFITPIINDYWLTLSMAFALHEDRLYFAISLKEVEHGEFDVCLCVDNDFIDTFTFLNTRSSTDIRVSTSSNFAREHRHWRALVFMKGFCNVAWGRFASSSFTLSLRICQNNKQLFCHSPQNLTAIPSAQYFLYERTWWVEHGTSW